MSQLESAAAAAAVAAAGSVSVDVTARGTVAEVVVVVAFFMSSSSLANDPNVDVDYYMLLGLQPTATEKDIKRAYRLVMVSGG